MELGLDAPSNQLVHADNVSSLVEIDQSQPIQTELAQDVNLPDSSQTDPHEIMSEEITKNAPLLRARPFQFIIFDCLLNFMLYFL